MKHRFPILLTMCILMVIGVALVPRLDISNEPLPRQGRTWQIYYSWPGASAKVIEQNVTSRIEGLCSSVNGVESVESYSRFGSGNVDVTLKEKASVASVKFEIASLLRQVRNKLPKGCSYPDLVGGEVVTGMKNDEKVKNILSYNVNADMPDREIEARLKRELIPLLKRIDGVYADAYCYDGVYMEISYNAEMLSLYGLTASELDEAITSYIGSENIVGDVMHVDENGERSRISLFLKQQGKSLEAMPVKNIDGKVVYLNNLATFEVKNVKPNNYFRINGMNTMYLNVMMEADLNMVSVSKQVKETIEEFEKKSKVYLFTKTYDRATEEMTEFDKLTTRSAMAVAILLVFVYFSKRNWKYLAIISLTLLANILMAVICYWMFDIRLHPLSIAGITVSLGLIIDSTIVMVDHYSYHHDHKAFWGILGAMLTTIGSLIIIIWLPDFLKDKLYDFSWMVIINLGIAIIVAAVFAPTLVDACGYTSLQHGRVRNFRMIHGWCRFYRGYMRIAQHRFLRFPLLLLVAGLFAFSLKQFVGTIDSNTYNPPEEDKVLHIRADMPVWGNAQDLNDKVLIVEAFLSKFKEIKRFQSYVNGGEAKIDVEFKPEYVKTAFPYTLENRVVSRLITIGGADWSTYGVSKRGFSNSLNLQYRSDGIEISGYDYDRLYRYAEDMVKKMSANPRVQDIVIETPLVRDEQDEFYMDYDFKMLAMDSIDIGEVHNALQSLLSESSVGYSEAIPYMVNLRSESMDKFDLWQLQNSYIKVRGRDLRVADVMKIERRKAKNCIPKKNQEYTLRVAFNMLGSWSYSSKYIKNITDEYNAKFPVGFRCINDSYGWYDDTGTQYWLVGLVVVIIFFICSIMFESLYKAFIVIMLIPVSMIGMFLTYHYGKVEFGTGGFAAMVLLCGLTVNAGIYLLNEYRSCSNNYIRAYNHKIIPILLTVASTILGLLPFLIDGPSEDFWFSFAVGSISGLIFSVVALVFVMPMLMKSDKRMSVDRVVKNDEPLQVEE